MTENERFLILETMCKLALAGKSDDEVISFGNMMAAFIGRNESVLAKPPKEGQVCPDA